MTNYYWFGSDADKVFVPSLGAGSQKHLTCGKDVDKYVGPFVGQICSLITRLYI